MTTMDTVEDFLRILRERPDVREAVRREILTEEVLALPQTVAEIAAMVRELVRVQAEHTARTESLETDVKGLKADVVEVKADVKGLKTDMVEVKADVKGLKSDMVEVKSDIKDLQTKVGGLIGSDLERRLPTLLPPLLSQRLDLRRTRLVYTPGLLSALDSTFMSSVEGAADEARIEDWQEDRLRVTDLILRARRKDGGAEVWIAVEASGTIGRSDIARASESAAALRAAFEEDADAVVVGYRIRDEDQARAEADGVTVLVVEEPRG